MAFNRIISFASFLVNTSKFSSFFLVIILFIGNTAVAQIWDKLTYNPYLTKYTFFDNGSHKISEKNDAWGRGAGINVLWQVRPKIKLLSGYSIGFIDGLKYDSFATKTASLHQLDLNAIYTPFAESRIQPGLFFGYTFNYLPQLKNFESKQFGTNVNLGYQVELAIRPFLNARYANTFAVSLSPHIRYNFRHDLGLVYNLNLYQSKKTIKELNVLQSKIEEDLKQFNLYELEIDSLTKISENVAEKTIENYKLTEKIVLLSEEKQLLETYIDDLEQNNTHLLDSIARLVFFRDSVLVAKKSDFYMIDSMGLVDASMPMNFKSGYYAAIPNYATFSSAYVDSQNAEVLALGLNTVLYHQGFFVILTFLTDNEEILIKTWRELGDIPANAKIYKF